MCRFLKISKSTYYFNLKKKENKIKNNIYDEAVISAFKENKEVYGTRRLKKILENQEIYLSRRKIKKIMNEHNLISKYTKLSFKNHNNKVNDSQITNLVNRKFKNRIKNEVIVSDLTYVQVNGRWNYICLLIDLFNREIIGHSVGVKKDASLVHQAFMQSNRCLKDIQIFHSDRGNEFNNKIIDKLLLAFNINRSLSKKGCPYDNAVAEATFKTFKTEFINDKNFTSLIQLKLELFDYINWYNNGAVHALVNINGVLYVGTSIFGKGNLYKSNSDGKFELMNNWKQDNGAVWALTNINGVLYVGTSTANKKGNLYKKINTNDINAKIEPVSTWNNTNGEVSSLTNVYSTLYVGITNNNGEGKIYKSKTDKSFGLMLGWESTNGAVWSLTNINDTIYIGTITSANKGNLYITEKK